MGKTMTLAGPKAWTVDEVIELCEKYADAEADVSLQHMLHLLLDLQLSLFDHMGILHTDPTTGDSTAAVSCSAQQAAYLRCTHWLVMEVQIELMLTPHPSSYCVLSCRFCSQHSTATCRLGFAGHPSARLAPEVHKEHTEEFPVGKGCC